MKRRWHHFFYNPEEALDHIYKVSQSASTPSPRLGDIHHCSGGNLIQITSNSNNGTEDCVHHCNDVTCPLYFFNGQLPQWRMDMLVADKYKNHFQWKENIQKRSTSIRQSIHFMGDLIVDWSSRVWVISEYSIAKKKNNLKYWFIQLGTPNVGISLAAPPNISFFAVDFNDGSNTTSPSLQIVSENVMAPPFKPVPSDPVYITFHQTVIQQLKNQTFLEMILKSKASKAEDRFYAVLPLFEHYKNKIKSQKTATWHLPTMLSVKLKLFEWMTISDKLNLLFLTGNVTAPMNTMILPTFATTTLSWVQNAPLDYLRLPHVHDDPSFYNFDLTDPSTLMLTTTLRRSDDISSRGLHFLHLKPLEYYVNIEPMSHTNALQGKNRRTVCNQLDLDPFVDTIDVVRISTFGDAAMKAHEDVVDWKRYCIFLTGNFEKNKWVLSSVAFPRGIMDAHWKHQYSMDHSTSEGFHIY
ncbi:unnamed protein product [Absidia cylindrospora]